MKKNKNITYFIIALCVFLITMKILVLINSHQEMNSDFKGAIKSITFGMHGTPEVVIEGHKYYLMETGEYFNQQLEIGDTLIKEKNSAVYKVVKRKTGKFIISK